METQTIKKYYSDNSLVTLLIANVITIFFAISNGWQLSSILVVYWFQSVIIGLFNFIRILRLEHFSTKNFLINGRPTEPSKETKFFTAIFFLVHYGFFHLIYAIFILSGWSEESTSFVEQQGGWSFIIGAVLAFFIHHLFSYIQKTSKQSDNINIGSLMFYPYLRIVPMHLIIITGAFLGAFSLLFFLVLKTISDLLMHIVERSLLKHQDKNI